MIRENNPAGTSITTTGRGAELSVWIDQHDGSGSDIRDESELCGAVWFERAPDNSCNSRDKRIRDERADRCNRSRRALSAA
jgi:hypothetical protein